MSPSYTVPIQTSLPSTSLPTRFFTSTPNLCPLPARFLFRHPYIVPHSLLVSSPVCPVCSQFLSSTPNQQYVHFLHGSYLVLPTYSVPVPTQFLSSTPYLVPHSYTRSLTSTPNLCPRPIQYSLPNVPVPIQYFLPMPTSYLVFPTYCPVTIKYYLPIAPLPTRSYPVLPT